MFQAAWFGSATPAKEPTMEAVGDLREVGAAISAHDVESWRLLRQASAVPAVTAQNGHREAQGRLNPVHAVRSSNRGGLQHPHTSSTRRVVPPVVEELEDICAGQLQQLLEQEHRNLMDMKKRASLDDDDRLRVARRSCAQAELAYRQLSNNKANSLRGALLSVHSEQMEAEIGTLVADVVANGSPMRASASPRSGNSLDLPARVHSLVDACQRQMPEVSDTDHLNVRALETVNGLAELLIEIDRDCHAMTLALRNGSSSSVNSSSAGARLVSATRLSTTPAPPAICSLVHQLQMENELLRETLRRPPLERNSLSSGARGHKESTRRHARVVSHGAIPELTARGAFL